MADNQENQKKFGIQKLYVKDLSFESPGAPNSFGFKQWAPKVDLNLANNQQQIDTDVYEVELVITATVSHDEKTAFLVEVHQAGLFLIGGFDDAEKKYLIGSQCLSILFPYAREIVSDLSVRGGFPPLVLSPVNFDALFQQHLQQQQQGEEQPEAAQGEEQPEAAQTETSH